MKQMYNPFMPDVSMRSRMVFKGGDQTTTSGLPDWARPYVESALGQGVDLHGQGAFENVAGTNTDQQQGYDDTRSAANYAKNAVAGTGAGALETAEQARTGQGIFGAGAYGDVQSQLQPQIDNQITRSLGQQQGQFSRSGNLGGARAQAASASAAGQIAQDAAAQEVAAQRSNASQGAAAGLQGANTIGQGLFGAASALGTSGAAQQQQAQNEGDASYQGIQRLFGLLGSGAVGSQSTSSGGGGK